MKFKKFSLLALFTLLISGCNTPTVEPTDSPTVEDSQSDSINVESTSEGLPEFVDYVSLTKLDLEDTSKVYAKVKVENYVDGDTTHFSPIGTPTSWVKDEDNILRARYNSCDTPESTGKVEPWGEAAKKFTRNALETAHSIIVQSDSATWNTDTTGARYLVWVWYQPAADADYRLLNLELVQEGLAKLKSASSYSLYETFNAANMQAILYEKRVYSSEKDPNFYYGKAQVMTIKELRQNVETYSGTKVCVNGLITIYDSFHHMAYAQQYDDEDGRWYGIDVYLGYNSYEIIKVGNLVRLVGTLSYYETGQNWQLTGLSYHRMNPDYEGSMKLLERNVEVVPQNITSADLSKTADENGVIPGEVNQSLYVKIDDLYVYRTYTTESNLTTSNGALTLYCKDTNNVEVVIRTSVLYNADGEIVKDSEFLNKTISATGIVTKYEGNVQIHVYSLGELTIN